MKISQLFIYQPITKLPIVIKDKIYLDNQGIKHNHYYGSLRNSDVRSKPAQW